MANSALEKQKELIKKIIKPFFKKNGFTNKGVKFYKDLPSFKVEAEIQKQRYYKNEDVENFRINYIVYYEHFPFYRQIRHIFGGGIRGENSWITTENSTDIEKVSVWLENELQKIPLKLDFCSNIDKVILWYENDLEHDISYAFIMKEFGRENELQKWLKEKEQERETFLQTIKDVEKEKETLLKLPDSLDKTVRLEGIAMKISRLNSSIEWLEKDLKTLNEYNPHYPRAKK